MKLDSFILWHVQYRLMHPDPLSTVRMPTGEECLAEAHAIAKEVYTAEEYVKACEEIGIEARP